MLLLRLNCACPMGQTGYTMLGTLYNPHYVASQVIACVHITLHVYRSGEAHIIVHITIKYVGFGRGNAPNLLSPYLAVTACNFLS